MKGNTKDRWVEYQKQHHSFETLSERVRTLIETFIELEDRTVDDEAVHVEDKIDRLKSDVNWLKDNVEWLRDKQQRSIEALAKDLFQVLVPLPPDDSKARDHTAIQTVALENDPQTPTAVAEKMDTTPKQIENATEYLKTQNFPIEQYEMEDGRFQIFKKDKGV